MRTPKRRSGEVDPVVEELVVLRRQVADLTNRRAQVVDATPRRTGGIITEQAYTVNPAISSTAPGHVVATIEVPDPGYPYIVLHSGFGVCRSPSGGGRTDMTIRLGDINGPDIRLQVDGPSGAGVYSQVDMSMKAYPAGGAIDGSLTLVAVALRVGGSGNGEVNSGTLQVVTLPADGLLGYA